MCKPGRNPAKRGQRSLQTLSPKLSILGFLAQLFFLPGGYVIPLRCTGKKESEVVVFFKEAEVMVLEELAAGKLFTAALSFRPSPAPSPATSPRRGGY